MSTLFRRISEQEAHKRTFSVGRNILHNKIYGNIRIHRTKIRDITFTVCTE